MEGESQEDDLIGPPTCWLLISSWNLFISTKILINRFQLESVAVRLAFLSALFPLLPSCGHRYETTSSDDSSSEDSSSSGSEEDEEECEEEETECGDEEQCKKVEKQNEGEELRQEGSKEVDKQEGESTEKLEMREKWVKEIYNESFLE